MKSTKRGEILTLMTIAVMAIIGIVTVISTTFLRSPKNKIAMNSMAMVDRGERDDNSAPAPAAPAAPPPAAPVTTADHADALQNNPAPAKPAPAAPATDVTQAPSKNNACDDPESIACKNQEKKELRTGATVPLPTAPPSGNEATKTDVNIAPTPFTGPLPGDADKWKCPGPACDKCGTAGWTDAGCQDFVAQHPNDAKNWNGRASGPLSKCGGAENQCTPGSQVRNGNTVSTCGNDGCLHESTNTISTTPTGNTSYQFSKDTFYACMLKDPSKTNDQCRNEANIVVTPTPKPQTQIGATVPFDVFKSLKDCVMAYSDCAPVPGAPGIFASQSQMNPYLNQQRNLALDKAGLYTKDICDATVSDNGHGRCVLTKNVDNRGNPLWQYLNDQQSDLYYNNQGYSTQDSCQGEVAAHGGSGFGSCVKSDIIDSKGNYLYQYVTSQQRDLLYGQQGLYTQSICDATIADNGWGVCVKSDVADSKGNYLYQYLTQKQVDDQLALQKQQQLQKSQDSAASCKKDCTGSCVIDLAGLSQCVPLNAVKIVGTTAPVINIFGLQLGSQSCGGEGQVACTTQTSGWLGNVQKETTCAKGLKPGVANVCIRDADFAQTQAIIDYLKTAGPLTPDQVQFVLQNNLKTPKYLPDTFQNLCGSCGSGGQCLYSSAKQGFVCQNSIDVINYYGSINKDTGKAGEFGGQCNATMGFINPGCNHSDLACSGGRCQLTQEALQVVANTQLNPSNNKIGFGGQQINAMFYPGATSLLSNGDFMKNFIPDKGALVAVGGGCVQALNNNKDTVRTVLDAACNDSTVAKAFKLPKSTGQSFCAPQGTTCKQGDSAGSNCPSNFVYCDQGIAPKVAFTANQQFGFIGAITDLVKGDFTGASKQMSGNPLGGMNMNVIMQFSGPNGHCDDVNSGCYQGLKCDIKSSTCQDLTVAAYQENYSKGANAVAAEQHLPPLLNGIVSSIATSLNGDYYNSNHVQAQIFQDQVNKLSSTVSNPDQFNSYYSQMYGGLNSGAKGEYHNLVIENRKSSEDALGNIADTFRQAGSTFGAFTGAYGGGVNFNPYMDAGEVIHDNKPIDVTTVQGRQAVQDKAGALFQAGFYTAMPVIDVLSVAVPAAKGITAIGEAGLKTIGEKEIAQTLTTGAVKQGIRATAEKGLFNAVAKTGETATRLLEGASEIGNKAIMGMTVASGIEAAQQNPSRAPAALIPLALTLIPGMASKVHDVTSPLINKITGGHFDTQIARDAVQSVVEQGYREGKLLTVDEAAQQALAVAKKNGLVDEAKLVTGAAGSQVANPTIKNVIQTVIDSPNNKKLIPPNYSLLRDSDIDQAISNSIPAANRTINVDVIARENAANEVAQTAKNLGINDPQAIRGIGHFLKNQAEPTAGLLLKDQANEAIQKVLQDQGIATNKAAAAAVPIVNGMVAQGSPHILDVSADDIIRSTKGSSVLTNAQKTQIKTALVTGDLAQVEFILNANIDLAKSIQTTYVQKVLNDPLVAHGGALPRNFVVGPADAAYTDIDSKLQATGKTAFNTKNDAVLEIMKQSNALHITSADASSLAVANAYADLLQNNGRITIGTKGLGATIADGVKGAIVGIETNIKNRFQQQTAPVVAPANAPQVPIQQPIVPQQTARPVRNNTFYTTAQHAPNDPFWFQGDATNMRLNVADRTYDISVNGKKIVGQETINAGDHVVIKKPDGTLENDMVVKNFKTDRSGAIGINGDTVNSSLKASAGTGNGGIFFAGTNTAVNQFDYFIDQDGLLHYIQKDGVTQINGRAALAAGQEVAVKAGTIIRTGGKDFVLRETAGGIQFLYDDTTGKALQLTQRTTGLDGLRSQLRDSWPFRIFGNEDGNILAASNRSNLSTTVAGRPSTTAGRTISQPIVPVVPPPAPARPIAAAPAPPPQVIANAQNSFGTAIATGHNGFHGQDAVVGHNTGLLRRSPNLDAIMISADGHGGIVRDAAGAIIANPGATAARLATTRFEDLFNYYGDQIFASTGQRDTAQAMLLATTQLDQEVIQHARFMAPAGSVVSGNRLAADTLIDGGTTFTAGIRTGNDFYMAQLGDSRLYRVSNGQSAQLLTPEHNWPAGGGTDARGYRYGILVSKSLGDDAVRTAMTNTQSRQSLLDLARYNLPDILHTTVQKGDILIAGSDSLQKLANAMGAGNQALGEQMLNDYLRDVVSKYPPDRAAQILKNTALQYNVQDDISVIVYQVNMR